MSAADTELSRSLQLLVDGFSEHLVDPDGIGIEQEDLQRLVLTLQVMQSMATNLEIEVRCLRDMEAGRDARTFLAEEVADHLEQLLPEVDGNVVKYDFVKRSRS